MYVCMYVCMYVIYDNTSTTMNISDRLLKNLQFKAGPCTRTML